MYQLQPYYQIQQPLSPWFNQSFFPQPFNYIQPLNYPQYSLSNSNLAGQNQPDVNTDHRALSNPELIDLLDKHTTVLKRLHEKDQQKQLPILIEVVTILNRLPRSTLISIVENDFFSLFRLPLISLLNQWCHQSTSLTEDEVYMFRTITKLIRRLIKAADDIKLIPSWLSDSSLLEAIAECLSDIGTTSELLDQNNKALFRYFTRLIDAYILYQQRLNDQNHPHKDLLTLLLQPIIECLSSSHFIHSLTDISQDTTSSMTTIQKFFLRKCPAFLTAYNGTYPIDTSLPTMFIFHL